MGKESGLISQRENILSADWYMTLYSTHLLSYGEDFDDTMREDGQKILARYFEDLREFYYPGDGAFFNLGGRYRYDSIPNQYKERPLMPSAIRKAAYISRQVDIFKNVLPYFEGLDDIQAETAEKLCEKLKLSPEAQREQAIIGSHLLILPFFIQDKYENRKKEGERKYKKRF